MNDEGDDLVQKLEELAKKKESEPPPELTDVICCRPGICPNCRSSGAVTDEAITCGPAPG